MLNTLKRIFSIQSFVIGVALMLYFLVMDNLGYSDVIELRLLNGVIFGVGLWVVLRKYTDREDATYFKSLWRGVELSMGASIIFAAMFWVYLLFGNTSFVPHMQDLGVFPIEFEPYQAAVMIIFEGLASGAVLSFMFMQYFRAKIPRDAQEKETVSKSSKQYEDTLISG